MKHVLTAATTLVALAVLVALPIESGSKGTPFVYEGDELGMTNFPFMAIQEFDDIEVKNAWKAQVLTGEVTADDFISHLRKTSRDHARTPMQWDDSPNGGFTSGSGAWLAVNPNYLEINARQATADEQSTYHYFRRAIAVRRNHPALIYGGYKDLDPSHASVFAYTRTLGEDAFLVVLNFSRQDAAYTLPGDTKTGRLVLSNRDTTEEQVSVVHLKGWEARVYKL